MVIASITGAALLLGTNGLASIEEQNPRQERSQQKKTKKQKEQSGQGQNQANQRQRVQRQVEQQQQRQAQQQQQLERRQQILHQQRQNQYTQQRQLQNRLAQQREQQLQQQRRLSQLRFQQQYQERLRQDQINLQNARSYAYSAPSYRYSRNGRYYQTNQYGVDMLRQAVNYGYEEGVRAGQADREDRSRFSYQNTYAYQDATYGYNGYHVDLTEYRYYFRQGFNRGYQDGYNSRSQYGNNSNGGFSMLGNILQQIFNVRPY